MLRRLNNFTANNVFFPKSVPTEVIKKIVGRDVDIIPATNEDHYHTPVEGVVILSLNDKCVSAIMRSVTGSRDLFTSGENNIQIGKSGIRINAIIVKQIGG